MFGIRYGWLLLGALLLTACGGSVADEGDGAETVASASAASTTKYHYVPGVEGVRWADGCGIAGVGRDCSFGLVLTYTKSYIDLKTTVHASVNQRLRRVTITVDTWSTSQIHSMIAVRPQDLVIGPLSTKAGTTYSVVVKDWKHRPLWTGQVTAGHHL